MCRLYTPTVQSEHNFKHFEGPNETFGQRFGSCDFKNNDPPKTLVLLVQCTAVRQKDQSFSCGVAAEESFSVRFPSCIRSAFKVFCYTLFGTYLVKVAQRDPSLQGYGSAHPRMRGHGGTTHSSSQVSLPLCSAHFLVL